MLRQLTRKDLPDKTGVNSLHIPVVYGGKLRFICDRSYASDQLCWLEDNDGIPVLIKDCELIINFNEYKKVIKALGFGNYTVSPQNHYSHRERKLISKHYPSFNFNNTLHTIDFLNDLLNNAKYLENDTRKVL